MTEKEYESSFTENINLNIDTQTELHKTVKSNPLTYIFYACVIGMIINISAYLLISHFSNYFIAYLSVVIINLIICKKIYEVNIVSSKTINITDLQDSINRFNNSIIEIKTLTIKSATDANINEYYSVYKQINKIKSDIKDFFEKNDYNLNDINNKKAHIINSIDILNNNLKVLKK